MVDDAAKLLTEADIIRALRRIESDLATAWEEGIGPAGSGNWYAMEQIEGIRLVCVALLSGDPMACTVALGDPRQDKSVIADDFNRPVLGGSGDTGEILTPINNLKPA